MNEGSKVIQMFGADGPIRKLLYYEEKNILITVTATMMLSQHAVESDGGTREILKVALLFKVLRLFSLEPTKLAKLW